MAGKYFIIATLSFLIAKFTFGEDVNYGCTNGNITLKANIRGIPEEILWKWNGNKVLEVDKISSEVYMQFKGRAYVNVSTGDLTITGLTEGDSGDYKAEVQVEKKLQYSQHRVEVIDPVADPIVTCEMSGSAVTLICASDLSLSTTYSWEGPNMAMPASGSELHLEITESRDSVYTCVVKNPVSELRANFTLQHCYTARGVVTNLVIAIAVLFFVFLGALGIWFYYKKYKVTASQQARCEMGDRENETPHENVQSLEKAELVHDKNNPDKGSLKNQEDNSN
ncbi:lymphocyte function-associated antigen 3-like isoform X1 [Conger conger]|uniref:lymphocyte function-associated antigen 3-like isoform X1 n=2 Tax=Conger conger TaxID=82655 RepID=UPI002A599838|nr:lymphocyte function-associated antigen 3-like isoform X1 [Conger conger]